jgi:hypothetical protein
VATNKIGYGTEVTLTLTLTSLASSATLVAGRESTAVDNTSTLAVDYLVSGKTKMGAAAPTANTFLEVWVYAEIEDTPEYPDPFDGIDSAETATSRNWLMAAAKLAVVVTFDATANQVYGIAPFSVAQLYGGNVPKRWGLFITQGSGQALSSTAGDHVFSAMPILPTVA